MRGPSCRYSHDICRLTAGAFDDAEEGLQPSFKSQVAGTPNSVSRMRLLETGTFLVQGDNKSW